MILTFTIVLKWEQTKCVPVTTSIIPEKSAQNSGLPSQKNCKE